MTAKFNVGIGNNIINAEISYIGTSGMKVIVTSEYPITSPINIRYAARGEYWATIDYPDGSSRDELYNFDGLTANATLAVGQSQWELSYIFGISAIEVTLVNWYIDFTEFTDKSYNYKKGNTNGMEYN